MCHTKFKQFPTYEKLGFQIFVTVNNSAVKIHVPIAQHSLVNISSTLLLAALFTYHNIHYAMCAVEWVLMDVHCRGTTAMVLV